MNNDMLLERLPKKFCVEGRWFDDLVLARAFAKRLVEEYQRAVNVYVQGAGFKVTDCLHRYRYDEYRYDEYEE